MTEVKHVDEWKVAVAPFLHSKVEEMHIMGYPQATKDDIWNCLVQKIWKGTPNMRIYEVVADIMHLKSSIFLSYLTTQSFQNDDLMTSIAALLDT